MAIAATITSANTGLRKFADFMVTRDHIWSDSANGKLAFKTCQ
jgi:hypothetical protein